MSKLQLNFFYNIALTLSTYIINLVVFPYVSRVLGVDNIGKIGFVENVVSYFSLFAMMGVATVGVREIASCGNNIKKRSEVFTSILSLLLISTTFIVVIYVLTLSFVPRFQEDKSLFVIGTSQLFMTSLLIEWLYQGLEDFKFITIRNLAIKILYVIVVFFVIKDSSDYILYFALTCSVVVINALINFIYSRHYVHISFSWGLWRKYLKPMFSLGIYKVLVSMYTTFNVIYLGFIQSDSEVGYYYTSIKLFTILLGVLTAFTTVMMPRMSSLFAEGRQEEIKKKIQCSFDLVICVSIPLVVFSIVLSPQIIGILAGAGYEGAILPMRIIMLNVLFVGLAQIWVIQMLLPMKKDKVILYSSIIGACVGIIANILLVGVLGAIGSAIVLIVAEIAGDLPSLIYALKNKIISFPFKTFIQNLVCAIPYAVMCYFVTLLRVGNILILLIAGALCAIYFMIEHSFILKGSFVSQYIGKFKFV